MKVVNTQSYYTYGCGGDANRYPMFVLTQDDAGKFAVYWGMATVGADPEVEASAIAGSGSKCSYAKSKFAFSGIAEEDYRA